MPGLAESESSVQNEKNGSHPFWREQRTLPNDTDVAPPFELEERGF